MDHASILQKENNDYYLKGPKYQPSTAPQEPIYYSASYPQAPEQLPFNISSQMAPVKKKDSFNVTDGQEDKMLAVSNHLAMTDNTPQKRDKSWFCSTRKFERQSLEAICQSLLIY